MGSSDLSPLSFVVGFQLRKRKAFKFPRRNEGKVLWSPKLRIFGKYNRVFPGQCYVFAVPA